MKRYLLINWYLLKYGMALLLDFAIMDILYIISKTAEKALYIVIFFLSPILVFVIPLLLMYLMNKEATRRFIPRLPRFPWEFPTNKQGGVERIPYIDPNLEI
jgi:hypothetical protein